MHVKRKVLACGPSWMQGRRGGDVEGEEGAQPHQRPAVEAVRMNPLACSQTAFHPAGHLCLCLCLLRGLHAKRADELQAAW